VDAHAEKSAGGGARLSQFAADVVTVPEAVLPEDMEATKSNAQHFLVDSRKAVSVLGWQRRRPRNGTNWLHPQI